VQKTVDNKTNKTQNPHTNSMKQEFQYSIKLRLFDDRIIFN